MSQRELVRLEREGAILIVSPLFMFGSFSDADLAQEWSQIETQLKVPEVQHVTVDLGEVPYFGSTMLEWLVLIWKRVRARGGRMSLCRCSEMGHKILAAARFDTLWEIYSDRESAMAVVRLP